ncbi:uncharacterized protein LOC114471539 [Gouania willdenowi]|uniref:uncharacterized protein LOC114471539 n=1 Tax=Gouania willdenowi TaxID=441366 RepID=UPI001055531D|nr:uncharacterized protein LOC114471539 [Gouania willdenowi]
MAALLPRPQRETVIRDPAKLGEPLKTGVAWLSSWTSSSVALVCSFGQSSTQSSSPQTEAQSDTSTSSPKAETVALSSEKQSVSTKKENEYPGALPPAIISSLELSSALPEEAAAQSHPQAIVNADSCTQDKTQDSDNALTSHLKLIVQGLSRSKSQESLSSSKSDDEESSESECCQKADFQHEGSNGPSWLQSLSTKANKKEKKTLRMLCEPTIAKVKETQGTLQRGDESQCQKSQVNWEQMEATKAIFDLLKEISGNSILLNIFDAILKPVMPILKKKVNSFLNKMNPTEALMATYIDTLCKKLLLESPPSTLLPPRTEEEKDETRERAHNLINAKYSNFLVLKKTDVESVFNLFQDREENKALVYMLFSSLLKELLPNEHSLDASTAALQKVMNPIS